MGLDAHRAFQPARLPLRAAWVLNATAVPPWWPGCCSWCESPVSSATAAPCRLFDAHSERRRLASPYRLKLLLKDGSTQKVQPRRDEFADDSAIFHTMPWPAPRW
jgi:hypothetical protein